MNFRDTINQKPKSVGAAIAAVIILIGAALIMRRSSNPDHASMLARAFYSTDDGKSWFVDDRQKAYPFDHDGKTAYRVYIFQCGEHGKPFAVYLERFTDAARGQAGAPKPHPSTAGGKTPVLCALEVRKPGETDWVRPDSAKGIAVMTPRCPPGESGSPRPVLP